MNEDDIIDAICASMLNPDPPCVDILNNVKSSFKPTGETTNKKSESKNPEPEK